MKERTVTGNSVDVVRPDRDESRFDLRSLNCDLNPLETDHHTPSRVRGPRPEVSPGGRHVWSDMRCVGARLGAVKCVNRRFGPESNRGHTT